MVNSLTPSSASSTQDFDSQCPKAEKIPQSAYFESPVGRMENIPAYLLRNLSIGDLVVRPAMIIDDTQTNVIIPGASALVMGNGLYIRVE